MSFNAISEGAFFSSDSVLLIDTSIPDNNSLSASCNCFNFSTADRDEFEFIFSTFSLYDGFTVSTSISFSLTVNGVVVVAFEISFAFPTRSTLFLFKSGSEGFAVEVDCELATSTSFALTFGAVEADVEVVDADFVSVEGTVADTSVFLVTSFAGESVTIGGFTLTGEVVALFAGFSEFTATDEDEEEEEEEEGFVVEPFDTVEVTTSASTSSEGISSDAATNDFENCKASNFAFKLGSFGFFSTAFFAILTSLLIVVKSSALIAFNFAAFCSAVKFGSVFIFSA